MNQEKKIPDCPVEMTLQLIGDKWKVLIIRDLLTGTKRFSELMRSVSGITQKVLTSHLRNMEADGIDTFIEIGPGQTLTNMIKKISPEARAFSMEEYLAEVEGC